MPIYDMIGNELSVGDICYSTSSMDYSADNPIRFGLILNISEPKTFKNLETDADEQEFNHALLDDSLDDDHPEFLNDIEFLSLQIVLVSNLHSSSIVPNLVPKPLKEDMTLTVEEKLVLKDEPVLYSLSKIELPHYHILAKNISRLLEIQSDISCGITQWDWLDEAMEAEACAIIENNNLKESLTKMFD